MSKLNQIVAIEKGVKARVNSEITAHHKLNQKEPLFNGFAKKYQSRDDEGETFPDEKHKVQRQAGEVLTDASKLWTELFDVTATKDFGNCIAKASVEVDGVVVVKDAPITFLLFLEKRIADIRTFIDEIPVLNESDEWEVDVNSGLFRTPEPVRTQKTKKVAKVVELAPATKEHPAQTQLVHEDVTVGFWSQTKLSGALPTPRKKELLARVDKLAQAVKFARENANSVEVEKQKVGEAVFGFLFR